MARPPKWMGIPSLTLIDDTRGRGMAKAVTGWALDWPTGSRTVDFRRPRFQCGAMAQVVSAECIAYQAKYEA